MDYSNLGTSGILTCIILAFAVIGFMKGLVRVLFMILTLLGAATASYFAYHHGLEFLVDFWPDAPESFRPIISGVAGIITFVILQKIFHFLVNPFETHGFLSKVAFGIPASLVSLLLGTILLWLALSQFRQKASIAELDYLLERRHDSSTQPNWIAQLKSMIDSSEVGAKFQAADPLLNQAKLNLAKLAVSCSNEEDYLSLTQDDAISQLVRNPTIWTFLTNQRVNELVAERSFEELLNHPEIDRILQNEDVTVQLEKLEIEENLAQ